MAKLRLSALPATYSDRGGVRCLQIRIGSQAVADPEWIEIRNIDDIRAAVRLYGRAVLAARPDASFSVHIHVPNGVRKPRGFDAAHQSRNLGTDDFIQLQEDADAAPLNRETTPEAAHG